MPDSRTAMAPVGSPTAAPVPAHRMHLARIEQSHLRCEALGLSPAGRPDFAPLVRGDLAVARERNRRLYTHAAPVMALLSEQIVDTQSIVVLCDAQGTILHTVGDAAFLARAGRVALAPGVNWAEHSKGTNAIGTALVEEQPVLVHAHEHFIRANHFLTCSAAPIFDPRGNMLGVLDVTGDQQSYHQHTMGLVRMSARMIENHWLSDEGAHRLRLHFHVRPEFIGTLMEGIVVVDGDGRVVGANRSALDLLDTGMSRLRLLHVGELFGTTVGALVDHFRAPLAMPMRLATADGRQFHVAARFNGPLGALRPASGADGAAGAPAAGPDARPPVDRLDDPSGAADDRADARVADGAGARRLSGLQYLRTGDPQVEAVVRKVQRVLDKDIPLLVLGETGTGKELLARAVHQDSARARQPFVAVNCAAIPEALIEAELFGHEEGAFTGARRRGAVGRIVQANGGTLFLDEIGDMPLPLQARLLRVLQERSVTPLGGHRAVAVDIAVVSATHRPLREMISAGSFREDLYYRLNGLAVRLPALRDRADLAAVAQRILRAECPQGTPEISPEVMALFRRYAWPGNIRQLANVLRTAALMAGACGVIVEEHLSDDFLEDVHGASPAALSTSTPMPPPTQPPPAPCTLDEAEAALVRGAIEAAHGNLSEAARRLGISRNTLYRKLRRADARA